MDIFSPIPKPNWPPRWRNVAGGVSPRTWAAVFALGLAGVVVTNVWQFQVEADRITDVGLHGLETASPWIVVPVCLGIGVVAGISYYAIAYLIWVSYAPLVRKIFFLALLPGFGGTNLGLLISAIVFPVPIFNLTALVSVTAWLVMFCLCLGQDEFSRPYDWPPTHEEITECQLDALVRERLAASDTSVENESTLEQTIPMVREVIHAWDPYRVASAGNPAELEPEVHALARLAPQWDSPHDAAEAVSLVFSTSFDDADAFSLEQCRDVASRLLEALRK